MLSRIAESFFWIGRYLERAHATARMLAEHHQLMTEDRSVPEELASAVLLDALSMQHLGIGGGYDLVRAVVRDPDNPSTVTGAVAAARANARAVRDVLSGEVFEALNTAHIALTRGVAFVESPGVTIHRIVERLLMVHGIVSWAMPRDESYQFLALGRALERLDLTSRLLAVRHDQLWPESGPATTLRASAAYSAFLRSGLSLDGDDVRAFLVLDPSFPRSMRRSAMDAEASVRSLVAMGTGDAGEVLREVGMLRSTLEFAWPATPDEIDRLATEGRNAAARASDIADEAFFRQAGTIVWSH